MFFSLIITVVSIEIIQIDHCWNSSSPLHCHTRGFCYLKKNFSLDLNSFSSNHHFPLSLTFLQQCTMLTCAGIICVTLSERYMSNMMSELMLSYWHLKPSPSSSHLPWLVLFRTSCIHHDSLFFRWQKTKYKLSHWTEKFKGKTSLDQARSMM